ncbi:hypothetical protein VOLCADRAFT_102769 [Volvox carteri f. nagariensis]|uniref:Uncharacterized protein n=1 Tax=Volvox carteri f. nagariensis TaxID=3068 RepID=D8THY7_VOLCA|nr:uncharacterized protein VOLCADRAFT_102769 [Volvox carteri f. nagariensis]EFJ53146.1 hypothetical protein VOLCADRAFT_102769 [Volvox carteri f. nagariensis]|eukprot:XP_002946151.1 hypothetical protein VOLCADRAFT_102769 [Volvox carteri f. nagariensis]
MWSHLSRTKPSKAVMCRETRLQGRNGSRTLALAKDSDNSNNLPWATVEYYTKKQERLMDKFGNLIHNERTVKEPAAWTHDAKMAFAIQVLAREFPNVTEEELRKRLLQLQALLPDLKPGPSVKPADLVRVAARLHTAAENLLILRDELPNLNVSCLASGWPQLLLADPERLTTDLQEVKSLLSGCGPAAFRELLEEFPHLLLPANAVALLDNVARLFELGGEGEDGRELGRTRAAQMLGSQPSLARSAVPLVSQTRGERDPEYLADTTRAEV